MKTVTINKYEYPIDLINFVRMERASWHGGGWRYPASVDPHRVDIRYHPTPALFIYIWETSEDRKEHANRVADVAEWWEENKMDPNLRNEESKNYKGVKVIWHGAVGYSNAEQKAKHLRLYYDVPLKLLKPSPEKKIAGWALANFAKALLAENK